MNTTVAHLAAFIPRDRAAQIVAGAPLAAEGVALIGDISGFTPLTETLARELSPARGGEELTRALNGVFAPLIDQVHRYGGSVIKFAGDALIVWFPRPPRARRDLAMRRALAAAAGMQAAIARHGQVRTPAGPFTLTMKVGMAYGTALRARLGDSVLGYEDVIGGTTLDRMAEAEHHASSGEIVLDPAGIAGAADLALVTERRDGYLVVAGPARPVAAVRSRPLAAPAGGEGLAEAMRPYLPAEVFEALRDGRSQPAELKPVVSIFVQFQGIVYEDGPAAEAQLGAYFAAAQAAAASYGGRVNRLLTGDKGSVLHLIFGAPRAIEELERRAALCLLELRRAAAELGFISAQRIGAAVGRVFAGPVGSPERRDYTVMGDTINLSARLMQGADAGQIVIDAALADRLAGEFTLDDLGQARLKGKAEPVNRFALAGHLAQPPRRAARAYGRDLELTALRRQVELLAGGHGGVAVLIGALGMGKSHLLAALRESTVAPSPASPLSRKRREAAFPPGADTNMQRPHQHREVILWAGAAAASYGQPRSGAVAAAALRELLGLDGADDPAARLSESLTGLLGARPGAAAFPYLARFLGLPLDEARGRELAALAGESLRWRVFELLGEIMRAACARRPIILALDDLQWADPTSRELIESLLPLASELPLLLILASRPVGQAAGGGWQEAGGGRRVAGDGWQEAGGGRRVAGTERPIPASDSREAPPASRLLPPATLRIELGLLDEAASLAVVTMHAPEQGLATREKLAERGQGNPLFLVELARTAAQGGDPDELPDSVQGLLLAQIDRLPGELRETLQLATVLGPGFAPRLLAALAGPGAPLDARLEALEAAGFLLRSGEGYGFRHILIRESAYGAMLYERRRGHHSAAAAAIERLYPTRLAERSGELAEHYERAENLGAAARYHGQAADGARLLYANEEAEVGYRHVLALLEKGDGDEGLRARTYLKLAQVQMNEGDYAAAQELYDVAFELLASSGTKHSSPLHRATKIFHCGQSEPETLDPGKAHTEASLYLVGELFEGLVTIDPDLNIIPTIAWRWRILDNGRRYRFEIRPDACWSDGVRLTARDFLFAWRRNLSPHEHIPLSEQLYPISGAEAYHRGEIDDHQSIGVTALDDLTIEVQLERPITYMLYLMAAPITFPLPEHIIATHGENWFQPERFVGNGRFLPTAWIPGRYLDLHRNPQHKYHTGYLDRVRFHFGASNDDIERQHMLDVVRCEDHPEHIAHHSGPVLSLQYFNTYLLAFDCMRAPFNTHAYRKAFATAINQDRLVHEVWDGIQQAATGGVVPPGIPGHSPGISRFEPLLAQRLLAEVGPILEPITLGCLPGMRETPEFIQRSWQEILGVRVELAMNIPVNELLDGLRAGRFQAVVFGYTMEFPEASNILNTLFYSKSPLNYVGWSNSQFDALMDQSQVQQRSSERFDNYHRADILLCAEEAIVVPLYHKRTLVLLKPEYSIANGTNMIRGGILPLDQIVVK